MSRHPFYEPLSRRGGVTLLETMIGLALVLLVSAVLTGLFAGGMKSFTYCTRQTTVLSNARQALEGGSAKPGIGWQVREALSATGILATQLALTAPGSSTPQYTLSAKTLFLTDSGTVTPLAKNITSLQYAYYNVDASGLIMVSTAAVNASLVTAWLQTQQTGAKPYTFFAAGRMRNRS